MYKEDIVSRYVLLIFNQYVFLLRSKDSSIVYNLPCSSTLCIHACSKSCSCITCLFVP